MPWQAVILASVGGFHMERGGNASVDAKGAKEHRKERKERSLLVFSLRPLRSLFAPFASTLAFKDRTPAQPCNKALP